MQYLGGKSRLAKGISKAILSHTDSRGEWVEPFVGMGSVLMEVAPHFENVSAGDIVPDVVLFWEALQRGWMPPKDLPVEIYHSLKNDNPSALRAFAGFGCSFGGKFFGGYAKQDGKRIYSRGSFNNALARSQFLEHNHVKFYKMGYEDWVIHPGDVVYCDPPYLNTTGYSSGEFDHSVFWDTMRLWVSIGATVFVSEFTAPPGWEPIWSVERKTDMRDTERANRLDRVFVWDR